MDLRERGQRRVGIGGHQLPNGGESEVWLTPPDLLAKLGPFDLDPCAAPEPRPWPTAAQMITLPDDGLLADWHGRAFVNPPYGKTTGQWLERLAHHGTGTALIFARTETDIWQRYVWGKASAILFLRGRLYFHHPDGRRGKWTGGAPSALVAYGPRDAEILAAANVRGAFVSGVSVR